MMQEQLRALELWWFRAAAWMQISGTRLLGTAITIIVVGLVLPILLRRIYRTARRAAMTRDARDYEDFENRMSAGEKEEIARVAKRIRKEGSAQTLLLAYPGLWDNASPEDIQAVKQAFWRILGVSENASAELASKVYLRLYNALNDLNPGGQIQTVFDVLSQMYSELYILDPLL